ncbi:MAG TPA: type IX secretion system membrane protein PorP/SprF [Cytophagales bacterium]|nr:type IX secretion system membrane protein PorP/SprF [Cytophagales bacterium]
MKKLCIIFVLLTFCSIANRAFAQQPAQFSQYMFNTLYYNPAFAGVEGATKFSVLHRDQWTGYTGDFDQGGAPKTTLITLNTPILMLKSGAGLYLIRDQIGPFQNLEAQFSYAYHLPIFKGKLSLGLRGGFFSQAIDFDKLRPNDIDDPTIPAGKESQIKPDMGIGLYYRAEKYFIGASFNHLLKTEFQFAKDTTRNALEQASYFTGGYDFKYSGDLTITPSVLVQTDFKQLSVQGGVLATYKDRFWGGLSYRQSEAAIIMLGMALLKDNSLKIGYSFDYIVTAQKAKSATSSELMLSYTLPVATTNKKSIIRTPRFRQ